VAYKGNSTTHPNSKSLSDNLTEMHAVNTKRAPFQAIQPTNNETAHEEPKKSNDGIPKTPASTEQESIKQIKNMKISNPLINHLSNCFRKM
jgi:hypothetical protein